MNKLGALREQYKGTEFTQREFDDVLELAWDERTQVDRKWKMMIMKQEMVKYKGNEK